MPWAAIGAALPAIGGLVGGIFGGKPPKLTPSGVTAQNNLLGTGDLGASGLKTGFGTVNQMQPGVTANQNTINQNWFPSATNALNASGTATTTGQNFLDTAGGIFGKASSALSPVQQYWQSILQGGPAAFSAISPAVQQSNANFQQAKNQISNFAPMGGGRAQALQQLPLQSGAAISNLYSQLGPLAAQGLANVGGLQTNLGSAVGGLGTSLSNANTGLAGGLVSSLGGQNVASQQQILNYLLGQGQIGTGANEAVVSQVLQQMGLGAQNGANLGGGIFNILKSLNIGGSGGGSGGGGLGSNPGYGGAPAGTA